MHFGNSNFFYDVHRIIAANYEARALGINRGMMGDEAKAKCPELHLFRVPEVRGKAELTKLVILPDQFLNLTCIVDVKYSLCKNFMLLKCPCVLVCVTLLLPCHSLLTDIPMHILCSKIGQVAKKCQYHLVT